MLNQKSYRSDQTAEVYSVCVITKVDRFLLNIRFNSSNIFFIRLYAMIKKEQITVGITLYMHNLYINTYLGNWKLMISFMNENKLIQLF